MEKIDARKLPPEALEHIRRQAFVLRKQGYTWTHIAEVCGVHVGTVLKWARRAQADDLDAVIKGGQRGRRHGSGRTLTLVQEEQLRLKIIGSNPAQLQLEFALWNRRAVMLAIKQIFGIDMPIRTVGEYLRRWGFTPQRPVKRALEQDPVRLKAWLEDEYPKIVARALQHVERLTRMGVHSLKIEGRTKSHFYVARTAQVYRRAIDDAVAGRPFDLRLMEDLESLANRGYTEGFLRRHVHDEYQNYERGNSLSERQQFVGEFTGVRRGELAEVRVKNRFAVGDQLELMTPLGNLQFSLSALEKAGGERTELAPGRRAARWP